jgi:hypothetical protein
MLKALNGMVLFVKLLCFSYAMRHLNLFNIIFSKVLCQNLVLGKNHSSAFSSLVSKMLLGSLLSVMSWNHSYAFPSLVLEMLLGF